MAVYIFTTIGIPVYYHYCGGELEEVSALVKTGSCCGEEEEEDNDCCQNETKHVSYQADFLDLKPLKANFELAFSALYDLQALYIIDLIPQEKISAGKLVPDRPPSLKKSDITFTSVFRI